MNLLLYQLWLIKIYDQVVYFVCFQLWCCVCFTCILTVVLCCVVDGCAATERRPESSHGHYHHVAASDHHQSYLTLALEAALIGLGQHRLMPHGVYAQQKLVKQEDRLIIYLQELELDATLVAVLKRQSALLLAGQCGLLAGQCGLLAGQSVLLLAGQSVLLLAGQSVLLLAGQCGLL